MFSFDEVVLSEIRSGFSRFVRVYKIRRRSGRSLTLSVVYLEAGPQAADVVSSLAAVTQHHVVCVAFTPADATAGVQDGPGPEDAPLQAGHVDEHLEEKWVSAPFTGSRLSPLCLALTWDRLEQDCRDSLHLSNTVFVTRLPSVPPSTTDEELKRKLGADSIEQKKQPVPYLHWPVCLLFFSFSPSGLSLNPHHLQRNKTIQVSKYRCVNTSVSLDLKYSCFEPQMLLWSVKIISIDRSFLTEKTQTGSPTDTDIPSGGLRKRLSMPCSM